MKIARFEYLSSNLIYIKPLYILICKNVIMNNQKQRLLEEQKAAYLEALRLKQFQEAEARRLALEEEE